MLLRPDIAGEEYVGCLRRSHDFGRRPRSQGQRAQLAEAPLRTLLRAPAAAGKIPVPRPEKNLPAIDRQFALEIGGAAVEQPEIMGANAKCVRKVDGCSRDAMEPVEIVDGKGRESAPAAHAHANPAMPSGSCGVAMAIPGAHSPRPDHSRPVGACARGARKRSARGPERPSCASGLPSRSRFASGRNREISRLPAQGSGAGARRQAGQPRRPPWMKLRLQPSMEVFSVRTGIDILRDVCLTAASRSGGRPARFV